MYTVNPQVSDAAASDTDKHATLAALWSRLSAWFGTCADYYEAAAAYEELARLSNAELARRGLSRDTLARDVCAAHERHS
jgi:hypothetical protein